MELLGVDLVGGVAEVDVEKFLRTIHPSGVFEMRAMNCPERVGGTYLSTACGYFNNHSAAAREAKRLDSLKPLGVYCTVCTLLPDLLGRANNRVVHRVKTGEATNDKLALRRTNLFIDVDADKISGVSSTDSEMRATLGKAVAIREQIRSLGWPEPIIGMSGNGGCLLYKMDMDISDESREAIIRLYTKLGEICGIKVDSTVFNASRLTKVLGTTARKGDEVIGVPGMEDKPHRKTWFVAPDSYDTLTVEQILEVAGKSDSVSVAVSYQSDGGVKAMPTDDELVQDDDVFKEPELPGGSEFDIDEWIRKHNVPVGPSVPWSSGRKYLFTELPLLCHNSPSCHTDIAACIYVVASGAISAKCSHERCTWTWKDLREQYEPDAYKPRESTLKLFEGESSSEISKAEEKAKEAAAKAKQAKKVLGELSEFMRSWRVERILGDENTFRLSGPFFYSESSTVSYLDVDFDTLYTFGRFNIALGRWRTGKNCVIPQKYSKVWHDAVGELLNRAVNVEGGIEVRLTSLTADRLVFLIENYAKPISFVSNPETRVRAEFEYKGVLYREYGGERLYIIDYSKVLKTLTEEHCREINKQSLTRTLDAIQSEFKMVKVLKKRHRWVMESQVERLRQIANMGLAEMVEPLPSELVEPAKLSRFSIPDEDDFVNREGADEFNEADYA